MRFDCGRRREARLGTRGERFHNPRVVTKNRFLDHSSRNGDKGDDEESSRLLASSLKETGKVKDVTSPNR